MNKKVFILTLSCFLLLGHNDGGSTANAISFGKNKNWIETEKSAVNLNNVNVITPVLTATITHSGDEESDLFREYRHTLSEKDIAIVTSWFNPGARNEGTFYKLKVEAFLMLDLFRLNLYESEAFVKKPKEKKVTLRPNDMTMVDYADFGRVTIFGANQVAGQKAIGKGQCPLCHTFDAGDNIGRCPNLFGIDERGATRVKEDKYMNEPVKVGEVEPATGIVKGAPDQIPEEYRREGAGGYDSMNSEDYIRESLMCPTCYVVKGFGGPGDKKSPMPVISKPPVSLSPIEINAVIAWMQSRETPGDFSRVTVPLPSDQPVEEASSDEEAPLFVTGAEPIDEMINKLGCPLCHTIPGIEGAVGELGPKLHEKTNAMDRIKDPRYKGKATNVKEYVRESILDPSAYLVFNETAGELYPDGLMPPGFKNQISVEALDKIVDFISQTEG